MKTYFGITLSATGLIALILGLTRIYSLDSQGNSTPSAYIAIILVLCGLAVCVMSANITKGETLEKIGNITKYLYIISFASAILITIIGLANVFSPQKSLMSLILLFIGFLSAISASSDAIAQNRKNNNS